MNRCCSAVGVNMMDGAAGRDILLLRGRVGGASGRSVACQGALTFLFFVTSFFHMSDLIDDIQKCFDPPDCHPLRSLSPDCPVHPSTRQAVCSNDHLPATCPCPQLEEPTDDERSNCSLKRSNSPTPAECNGRRRWKDCDVLKK